MTKQLFSYKVKALPFYPFQSILYIGRKLVISPHLFIIFKGVIEINIEIEKPNRLKEFFRKCHSRLEDMMFDIVQKLPDKLLTDSLMNWMDRYTTKRINQLKQQNVKNTWTNVYLQKAVDEISNRQQS